MMKKNALGRVMGSSSRDYDIFFDGAVEQSDGRYVDRGGNIKWYNEEGESHREDGPAEIYLDGNVEWCLNNRIYFFDQWCTLVSITDEDAMMLRLRYG